MDYKHILRINSRVTCFYVIYILVNFFASLLGPSTVLLMIADTLMVSFDMNLWVAYTLAILPGAVYTVVCFKCKSDIQIQVAAVLSSLLGVVMIGILVGSVARIFNQSPINPSSLILYSLIGIFLIAGVLHPREFKCLFPGVLYFISLPAAFVLLNIYSLTNLNNISWGTREIVTKVAPAKTSKLLARSKQTWVMQKMLNE